ncbi:ABC transporter permease [Opitutus sp. ER46]|uniref:ABC transporter permease n=1 Tax=Opitutus sp. ER46 TaxID=2161864 RepID=UPI000D31DAAF|nr:ABC transporter permease [Opitutus sp. ER46]PTY00077.1 ABC transporter [Opitutus sp. ER46]
MIITEILRLAFSSLTSNKLRSILTILGIAVGVFSVIGVMTLINGMRSSIESGLNVLGANSFQVSKWPPLIFSHEQWMKYRNRRDLNFATSRRFKELMADSATINLQIGRGGLTVVVRDRRTNPNVRLAGSDENFITAFNYDVGVGRNIGLDDVEYGRPVCVLGADVAQRVYPEGDALGQLVRIGGQNYTVIGVLKPKGSSFGQSQDNFVLTPITRFLAVYGTARRSISINVQAPSQAELPATQEKATGMMRLVRGLHPEDPNDFEVFSNESLIEAFNKIANVVAVGALIVSGIALLASGVGVMNIMLVSVTERTKEIGVRKSIGAKKVNILLQFLAEAVALSLIGGSAGIAIGVGGGNLVAFFMHTGITFPWLWAGIGLVTCGGIGIVFGLYPAWKAASLDPIEALRYE